MTVTSESLQQAFGYLFEDEVACLKELARSLPDNPVVFNIGAGSGTSSLAFLESRPDLSLFTIDIQDADSPFGSLYAERDVFNRAGIPGGRWHQYHGESQLIPLRYHGDTPPRDVDMVFIDGDHEYFAAKGDITGWLPRIKPSGIMAVHDFEKVKAYARPNLHGKMPHPLPWPGVDRAVRNYLCGRYPVVAHVDTLIAFRIG